MLKADPIKKNFGGSAYTITKADIESALEDVKSALVEMGNSADVTLPPKNVSPG